MLLTLLAWGYSTQAQSVNYSKFGKGLQFIAADSSFSLKFSTRFQFLYSGSQNEVTQEWEDRLQIRRARLKFDGFVYSPRLVYKIELGLSNSDIGSGLLRVHNQADNIILDAVAKWEMAPKLFLWVGQTKLPGNRERVISSQQLQFVDRSLLNANFNLDRDAGLQLRHEHQAGQVVLREIASISMGEGRNITVDNAGGYDYTARLEVLPLGHFTGGGDYFNSDLLREKTPKLSVAASFDYNHNTSKSRGQLGSFLSDNRSLRTIFIDGMFKYQGFSAMAEYADRKAPDGPVVAVSDTGTPTETFVTGTALNAQAGYLFKTNWEVAGRYTTVDFAEATQLLNQKQYTLALSRYVVGHSLKVQSDMSLIQTEQEHDAFQFRIQMELSL
nr:OprO/OprP family phosphate-selective porin [Pontibacter silvestris]